MELTTRTRGGSQSSTSLRPQRHFEDAVAVLLGPVQGSHMLTRTIEHGEVVERGPASAARYRMGRVAQLQHEAYNL